MDNLNTIGGGGSYDAGETFQLALTFGLSRPDDPFQRQTTTTLSRDGFLPAELVVLDRPRFVVASRATVFPFGRSGDRAAKLVLYGEGHFLASGERQLDGGGRERLPGENGYVLGAQLGGWQVSNRSHLNVFFRYARGLAAFDPLSVPFRPGEAFSTDRAREIQLGLSGNYENGAFGLQLGAYYRNFRSPSPGALDGHRLAEGVVVARPMVWLGQQAGVAAELSYQAMQTTRLDEVTGRPVRGGVTKLGLIPFISPFGRDTYTRPQLRLIYSLTLRDADARRLYPVADPRSRRSAEHFLGIGAEWWFDSSSYNR
jgi:maltoporin